jgi:PncC family amidohydrolase
VTEPLVALAARLVAACMARGLTVATAESCTGGLVAHLITEVPGASACLRGGVIAYADEIKRDALGVPADVLAAHGAVSAQVALAMAEGVRDSLGADLAVAVTGIAGPGGGTPEKPVGLTYVAVAGPLASDVERHQWVGDRTANKLASAEAALRLLVRAAGTGEVSGSDDATGATGATGAMSGADSRR